MSPWAVAVVRVGPALSILAAQPGTWLGPPLSLMQMAHCLSQESHSRQREWLWALQVHSHLPIRPISYQVELVPSSADLMGIGIWHSQAVVLALQASSSMAGAASRLSQSPTSASTAWRERDLCSDSTLAPYQLDSLGQAWTSVRLFVGWDVVM